MGGRFSLKREANIDAMLQSFFHALEVDVMSGAMGTIL